jgi:ubiquinone/menaquinone biosynthesis C-methylase UbiE
MVEQAKARNAEAIERGAVDVRHASAEKLPFEDGTFDAGLAINSMQVWPDIMAGLREMRRVIRSGDRVALGFTPYSGRPRAGVPELLSAAGFAQVRVVDTEHGFCVLALKP